MTLTEQTSTLLAAGGASSQQNGEIPAPKLNGHAVASQEPPASTLASGSGLKPLDASRLQITRNPNPSKPAFDNLQFGHTFSPHMLTVDWSAASGWQDPQIVPYGDLHVSPAAPCLQYASGLFEGMKAYRCARDPSQIRLFRPDKNMERMNRSAARAGLPTFNPEEMIKLLRTLVKLDQDYVPSEEGQTLYMRPTLIGTTNTLGMGMPTEAKLYCILSPVGSYWASGFKPVSLLAREDIVRAWTGGTGCYKVSANYMGPTVPAFEAANAGYAQVLWLYGERHELQEVGAMNFWVVFETDDGKIEVATPPLTGGHILPGVTRDSVLTLLKMHASGQLTLEGLPPADQLIVSERTVLMSDVIEAVNKGKMREAFGSGTAAIISPADRIGFRGTDYRIPVEKDGFGPIARVMLREVVGRQIGSIEHPGWSVLC